MRGSGHLAGTGGVQVIQSDEVMALQRFPALQSRILSTMDTALDEYRKKSREFTINLVKMEGSLVIPQLFKVAEEQFGSDKRDMGPDAEWGQVSGMTYSCAHRFMALGSRCVMPAREQHISIPIAGPLCVGQSDAGSRAPCRQLASYDMLSAAQLPCGTVLSG